MSVSAGKFSVRSFTRLPFRIALLVFMTAWFGVIVPGHQRGSVQLSDARSNIDHADCGSPCCASDQAGPTKKSNKPASNCAICYYMFVALPFAAPVVTELPPIGPPVLAEKSEPTLIYSADQILSFSERGPPAFASI